MGLAIYAFSHVERAPNVTALEQEEDEEDWNGHFTAYTLEGFEDRLDGMTGDYQPTGQSEEFYFHAGKYSEYNEWRNWLAVLALGVPAREVFSAKIMGQPFVKLIHFADNEGVIGPKTSAQLRDEFRQHRERIQAAAERMLDQDESAWFMQCYDNWQRAFDLAAQDGAVIFM